MTLRKHTEKSIREKQQKICEKWDLFIAERESAVAELEELVEDEVIISGNEGSIIADPTRFAGQSSGDFSVVEKEHYLSFHSEYHAIEDITGNILFLAKEVPECMDLTWEIITEKGKALREYAQIIRAEIERGNCIKAQLESEIAVSQTALNHLPQE